ncbi:hypothetical protein ACFOWZ_10440 [Lentzea rhizosphaerae]|uniref:Uncharacterized protein n=1 Tax=Lentzea rhizosphaerae TaxID=2041025 RepID=A0ABV8BS41_9PSEU
MRSIRPQGSRLWWAENSKEAYSSGLANLATALTNWRDCRAGSPPARSACQTVIGGT